MNSVTAKLYTFCDWLMKLAYLNLLWIIFSLAGLVVFGIWPAFVAMFTIIQKWFSKETDVHIFKTFLEVFKKEFISSNILGILMLGIGGALYLNLVILRIENSIAHQLLLPPMVILIAIYFMILLYLFPVYIHFKINSFQIVKTAFFISILNFHYTFLMILAIIGAMLFFTVVPAAFILIGASLISVIFMWGGHRSFQRTALIQQKTRNL